MSIEGLAFLTGGGASEYSSFSISGRSGSDVFERVDFLPPLDGGATLGLAETLRRVLEGGFVTFSSCTLSGSVVWPRFRLQSIVAVSGEALATREDRRGGTTSVIKYQRRDCHTVLHVVSRSVTSSDGNCTFFDYVLDHNGPPSSKCSFKSSDLEAGKHRKLHIC
ncbi:hypothetical protein BYT27DRAFT_6794437 [Phlegmacium glaucopus]|nr:hypothetical protein BYT27DRAFT_6794437 [Phlegmacium glaucopus]